MLTCTQRRDCVPSRQLPPPAARRIPAGNVTALALATWEWWADAVAETENGTFTVAGVQLSVIDFTNALMVCAMLRSVVTARLHWMRLLTTVLIMSVGGTTMGA